MQKIRKKYCTVKTVELELTYARTYESEFIGSFRSLKTSGEPKIRKIHSRVGARISKKQHF